MPLASVLRPLVAGRLEAIALTTFGDLLAAEEAGERWWAFARGIGQMRARDIVAVVRAAVLGLEPDSDLRARLRPLLHPSPLTVSTASTRLGGTRPAAVRMPAKPPPMSARSPANEAVLAQSAAQGANDAIADQSQPAGAETLDKALAAEPAVRHRWPFAPDIGNARDADQPQAARPMQPSPDNSQPARPGQLSGLATVTSSAGMALPPTLPRTQASDIRKLRPPAGAPEHAMSSDLVSVWLGPVLGDRVRRGGLPTLGDLVSAIRAGHRWWAYTPGVGDLQAQAIEELVRELLR